MGLKLKPFSSRGLRQRISAVHPTMMFLSRPSSPSVSAGGMRLRTQSEENLQKLDECMDNMDDDVTKLFLEFHQTDLREDTELLSLLNDYFTTSKGVSQLCESLRNLFEKGGADDEEHHRDERLLIDQALRDFKDEKLGYGGSLEASFRKTIQDLRNFTDSDLLSGDFMGKTQMCHRNLAKMIVDLEKTMRKIDKRLNRVRGVRAIVAAALTASLIAVILACKTVVAACLPWETVGKLGVSLWRRSTAGLKREKTAMTAMERGTVVALKEVEKISKLVSKLESVERSIRLTAESAVKKRSSVDMAMREMEKEKTWLESTLVDLERETGRCDEFARFGRTVARDRIAEFLSRGNKNNSS